MYLLHVVVIQGGGGWQRGLTFWLLVAALGGGFAYLADELRDADALLTNLCLATIGAAACNQLTWQFGQDPLALVFDVRVFWAAAGALLCLSLIHDLSQLPLARRLPIGTTGGLRFLILWLSGWPAEPGLLEATYGSGLVLKLLPGAIHYQVRRGWVRIARAVPLEPSLRVGREGSTLILTVTRPGEADEIRFVDIVPTEHIGAFATAIARGAGAPTPA